MSVGESFGVDPFSATLGALHEARGNYTIPPLRRALPWPYHCLYINRRYREDLVKQENIQSKR